MRSVLVTGDSRGLGLTIVEKLLNETDYFVIGISRTTSSDCLRLTEQFKGRYVHHEFDLENVDGLKKFYQEKLKNYPPFIGYVNNAALAYDDIITNLNIAPLERMFKVNVISVMYLSKLIIRNMLLHKSEGSIVHISSISAHTGYKGLSMYAATKGALESFSKNTSREWGPLKIRSNCVCPGFMSTEMSSSLSVEQKNRIYNRTSLKEETDLRSVASTVIFLLSSGAKSITGQVINVDSGTI